MTWLWYIIRLFWAWLTRSSVRPVGQLTATHIGGNDNMEGFRIAWPPSPSLNVDRHELYVALDGGSPTKTHDLIASAVSQDVEVPTGATVTAFVRTYGDNGTQADSAHLVFEATDETQVLPVGGLTATWLRHTP